MRILSRPSGWRLRSRRSTTTCATASTAPMVRNAKAVVAIATWKASSQPGRPIENWRAPSEKAASSIAAISEQQRRHAAQARLQRHDDRGDRDHAAPTSASVSPSDSAASGSRRRSCDQRQRVHQHARSAAMRGARRCGRRARGAESPGRRREAEAEGPEQVAGDGDEWQQQARTQGGWSTAQMMSHRRRPEEARAAAL